MSINFLYEKGYRDIYNKSSVEKEHPRRKNLQSVEVLSTSTKRGRHRQKWIRMTQELERGGKNASRKRRDGRH